MQAVAVMTDGAIEPYEAKLSTKEHRKISYWTVVIRSLIWKKRDDPTVEYADFIIDPDGVLSMILNEAVEYEKNSHRPAQKQQFNKEI